MPPLNSVVEIYILKYEDGLVTIRPFVHKYVMTRGMKLERQRSNRTFCPATAWHPKTTDLMVFLEKCTLSVQEKEPIYLHIFVCFSVHVSNKNVYVCVDRPDVLDLKRIISYLSGFIKAYLFIKAHTHIHLLIQNKQ